MKTYEGLFILNTAAIEDGITEAIDRVKAVINEAGGPSQKHRVRIAVGAAYGSDIDHVLETLERVATDHEEVCTNPAPRVRFRAFGESSLNFELLCWIERPVDRGRLRHELGVNVYKAFVDSGIEIPFPQRDLHVRTMPDLSQN